MFDLGRPPGRPKLFLALTGASAAPSIAVDPGSLADAGDIPLGQEAQEARSAIEAALTRIVGECAVPFSLGGDHSVTYPVLRACRALAPVTILHVDAHGDLYDQFPLPEPGTMASGDRFSHACPFARIMESSSTTPRTTCATSPRGSPRSS